MLIYSLSTFVVAEVNVIARDLLMAIHAQLIETGLKSKLFQNYVIY